MFRRIVFPRETQFFYLSNWSVGHFPFGRFLSGKFCGKMRLDVAANQSRNFDRNGLYTLDHSIARLVNAPGYDVRHLHREIVTDVRIHGVIFYNIYIYIDFIYIYKRKKKKGTLMVRDTFDVFRERSVSISREFALFVVPIRKGP